MGWRTPARVLLRQPQLRGKKRIPILKAVYFGELGQNSSGTAAPPRQPRRQTVISCSLWILPLPVSSRWLNRGRRGFPGSASSAPFPDLFAGGSKNRNSGVSIDAGIRNRIGLVAGDTVGTDSDRTAKKA